jgi:hypothetical protein
MHLSTFSVVLPIVIGGIRWASLHKPLRILYLFILLSAFIEFGSWLFFQFHWNNLIFFEIYTFVEFIAFSIIYWLLIQNMIARGALILTSVFFVFYLLYQDLFESNLSDLETSEILYESIILVTYFVYYLLETLNHSKSRFLETQPHFILTIGLIVYFLGNFLVYLFYDNLNGAAFLSVWSLHSILNLMLNFVYTWVLWKSKRA